MRDRDLYTQILGIREPWRVTEVELDTKAEEVRAESMCFSDTSVTLDVCDIAYAKGIRTVMRTAHDRVAKVCDQVRAKPDRYSGSTLYPCMPYAHTYANAVTEQGMIGALKRFLPYARPLDALMRGRLSAAKKHIEVIATLLIDAETKMFARLPTAVISLQNVVADLLLGPEFKEALSTRSPSHVRWPRCLRQSAAPTALPPHRDGGVHLRRDSAAGGNRMDDRWPADRIDRSRRIQPREHSANQVAHGRDVCRASTPVVKPRRRPSGCIAERRTPLREHFSLRQNGRKPDRGKAGRRHLRGLTRKSRRWAIRGTLDPVDVGQTA